MTLNPNISTDCVIFGFDYDALSVLLIEKRYQSGNLADFQVEGLKLPGSLIYDEEDLDQAAQRVLRELTGVEDLYLVQFSAFGTPGRVSQAPDHKWLEAHTHLEIKRVVTVAYFSLVSIAATRLREGSCWIPVNTVGQLAFDHNTILEQALTALRLHLKNNPRVALELLPEKFSLRQLQTVYEVILGRKLDNRNFRKKIMRAPYIKPLREKQKGVAHKPATLYSFDLELYTEILREDFGFIV